MMKNNQGYGNSIVPSNRVTLVLVVFLVMAGFLLFSEHKAHILNALPWLILLACPLLHIFMHHGHNTGNKHE